MAASLQMERLMDRVTLSKGRGDRKAERLCVMTFVALLAGERHTDSPRTASSFIRQYAVRLNDYLPTELRQQLKVFAPRIVGTNDGTDNLRIEIARSTFENEVLPRLEADHGDRWLPDRIYAAALAFARRPFGSSPAIGSKIAGWARVRNSFQEPSGIAREAADLLIHCAQSAPSETESGWYWAKSIDLLDRFCDTGPAQGEALITDDVIRRAEEKLATPSPLVAAWQRMSDWAARVAGTHDVDALLPEPSQPYVIAATPARHGEWDEVWSINPAPEATSVHWIEDMRVDPSVGAGSAKPSSY